jgi:trk system potassium uptake protein TrkA
MYELRLPLDSAIVAVIREEHVVIPQPESVLAVGDEVLAIARPEVEDELRAALD